MRRRAVAIAVTVWVSVAACGSSSSAHAVASPVAIPVASPVASPGALTGGLLGTFGSPGCATPTGFHGYKSPDSFPEVGADSTRGSVWALFFNPVPPPAGQDIKVVWRMTGTGPFTFHVSDSSGEQVSLAWGPEGHDSSTWDHPGDEVGTGFNFPHAGCWDLSVTRTDTSADLWLTVIA